MKRCLASFLVCAVLLQGCYMPQVVVKRAPPKGEKVRVAVIPFNDMPGYPGSGKTATEAMTTRLLAIPSYEIIERGNMDQVLSEQMLSATGAIDPKTAKDIGKLLGADVLVLGSVIEYQEREDLIFPPAKATVSARMVRTDTGALDWSGELTSGWPPLKWISCIFWPLGIFWLVTSPTTQSRVQQASGGIARSVAKKSD